MAAVAVCLAVGEVAVSVMYFTLEFASQIAVLVGVLAILLPHPSVFLKKPSANKIRIETADWKKVGWEERIAPMRTGKRYVEFCGRRTDATFNKRRYVSAKQQSHTSLIGTR